MLNLLMRRMVVAEKNKKGEELLSDGEVLDILYDWMGRETRNYTLEHEGRKLLAREVLEILRENEPEEKSNDNA